MCKYILPQVYLPGFFLSHCWTIFSAPCWKLNSCLEFSFPDSALGNPEPVLFYWDFCVSSHCFPHPYSEQSGDTGPRVRRESCWAWAWGWWISVSLLRYQTISKPSSSLNQPNVAAITKNPPCLHPSPECLPQFPSSCLLLEHFQIGWLLSFKWKTFLSGLVCLL